jgi:hypothetical protein
MNYPGSTQLGIGKKLLEQYPWHRFEPHPEWVDAASAGMIVPADDREEFHEAPDQAGG